MIEQFIAELGWEVDDTELKQFQKQVDSSITWVKRLGAAVVGAVSAFGALATVTNAETVRNIQLAKSVGLTAASMEAWTGVLRPLGFDVEKVVDLMEEMNNKIGEMKGLGEMTAVRESMQQLGLDFKLIRDLKPEDQFNTILQAAKDIGDEQIAVSAVDMLLGGEANRVLGFLRTYEGSVEEILNQQRALIQLTDEGREGALMWSRVWNDLTTVGGSLLQQASGLFGKAIAPMIQRLVQWISLNRELVQTKVVAFVNTMVAGIKALVSMGSFIASLVQRLGGLENVVKAIGLLFAAWKISKIVTSFDKMLKGAQGIEGGLGRLIKTRVAGAKSSLGAFGIIALGALAWEDLWVALNGGKSAFSEVHDWLTGKMVDLTGVIAGVFGKSTEQFMHDFEVLLHNGGKQFEEFTGMVSGFWAEADLVVSDFVNSTLESLGSMFSKIGDWFSDLAGWVKDSVLGLVFSGSDVVSNVINNTVGTQIPRAIAPSNNVATSNTNNNQRSFTIDINVPVSQSGPGRRAVEQTVTRVLEKELTGAVRNATGL